VSFPVILRTSPDARHDARLYYEVAANGVFQVKETATYRAVTRVDGVPGLQPGEQRLEIRFAPLPAALLEDVLAFFREVYERFDGEAIVILFHHPHTGEYRVAVPLQRIPGYYDGNGRWRAYLELDYAEASRPGGFLRFGTIHSHAELAAYASATDCEDERFQDGLHVVYGHLHRQEPSRAAAFVAGGVRFALEPEQALERCEVPPRAARSDWMARVSLAPRSAPFWSPR
jgi:hypothetical protein